MITAGNPKLIPGWTGKKSGVVGLWKMSAAGIFPQTTLHHPMRLFGTALLVIGAVSLLLPFIGLNFLFLAWINNWGTTVSWLIRFGLLILGAILYFMPQEKN
ncbi:MAG: hypothetical protein H7Z75_17365 [Ferruginibacter sp.]|nr:hypothetical protein [Cytophagales bacterium]